MGRKTWESLPEKIRPLPNRFNVVVSRDKNLSVGSVLIVNSLDAALQEVSKSELKIEQVFVIGGGQLYAAAIRYPACRRLYLTEVDGDFGCDVFFPELPAEFVIDKIDEWQEEQGLRYRFTEYRRS